jgi:hypothetical protein
MLSFGDRAVKLGAMKALQATCIVGAITFTGMIHQVGGNTPGATVPDALAEAAVSVETPGALALSAAVPEASAAGSGLSLMPQAEIGDDTFEAKWMALGHHDAAQRCRQRAMRPMMPPTRRR